MSISLRVPVTFDQLYQKVEELLESSEQLNESQTASLSTLVQKLSCKGEILQELDAKISEAIENPEELETEVFKAKDIQDTILEKTEQIKHFFKLQNLPKVVSEPHPLSRNSVQSSSLSVTATAHVPLVSPPSDVQSQLPTSSSHGSISTFLRLAYRLSLVNH